MAKLITKIEVIKTVGEQVLETPFESIFMLEFEQVGGIRTTTVLHRTGEDGWLTTRTVPGQPPGERYLKSAFIKAFIDNPNYDAVVHLLESGPR